MYYSDPAELVSAAPVTFALIAINIIVFLLETAAGGSTDIRVARRFGAMTVRDIRRGQWWRLITSMFVHFGFVHLACNMVSLLYLGVVIEMAFGTRIMTGSLFLIVTYLVSGLLGNLLTWAVQESNRQYDVVSAGASGAICGLLGVYVAMLFVPSLRAYLNVGAIVTNVFLCIAPGLGNRGINLSAHVGGLIGGFLIGTGYFWLLFSA